MVIGIIMLVAYIAILGAGGLWLLMRGVARKLSTPQQPWKLHLFGGAALIEIGIVSILTLVTSAVGLEGLTRNYLYVLMLAAIGAGAVYKIYERETGEHRRIFPKRSGQNVRDIRR